MGDGGALELLTGLRPACRLVKLSLADNHLGKLSALAYCTFVTSDHCGALRHLDLENNAIGAAGFKACSRALLHPKFQLLSLAVLGCDNENNEVYAAARALERHVVALNVMRGLIVLRSAQAVRRVSEHSAMRKFPRDFVELVAEMMP